MSESQAPTTVCAIPESARGNLRAWFWTGGGHPTRTGVLFAIFTCASPAFAGSPPESPPAPSADLSDSEGARNLLTDLERIVTSTESGGWFLDSEARLSVHPALLESICRASRAARAEALRQIRRRAALEGDPRAIFAADGHASSRFARALSVERQHEALEYAESRAEKDCPFWVRSEVGFQSRQTDAGGWSLGVETGGNLQFRHTAGRWTFGGGGLGRVLSSVALSDHLSVLFGAEFGGGAMLRPGKPETEFVINYFPAIPVVFRIRKVNFRYDIEVGPVALFQADNTRLSYGGRLGTSIGILALRTRNVLPWAGVAATYEYYFQGGGRPAAHFIRGGLRVGILWGR